MPRNIALNALRDPEPITIMDVSIDTMTKLYASVQMPPKEDQTSVET